MNTKLVNILAQVTGLFGLLGVYFIIRLIIVGDEAILTDVSKQESVVSPFLRWGEIIFYIAVIIAVGSSIWNLVKNPQLWKGTLISWAFLIIVLVISYVVADGGAVTDVYGNPIADGEPGPISKWVSVGLYYTYILSAIAIVLFVYGFVKSLFKI